ncbi:MAG: hypothetical protein HY694_16020 [Deltaproteobacteria bacterium]|nr:hypothetical protein [Deltaproteobacteria bacterium]
MKKILVAACLLFLSGCTQMVHELKTDPAIVGMTGWWFSFGLEASPASGGIPFPVVKFGRGTLWRVGIADSVTVKTGEEISVSTGGAATAPGQAATGGEASLSIATKGTASALEKMKDLYK